MLGDFPGPDLPNLRKAPRRDVVRVSLEGPEVHRWVLSDAWAQRGERIWWTVSHGDHPLRATVTFDIPVGEKHVVRFDDVLDQLTQVGPKGIFDVINADTTSIFLRREGIDVRGGR